MDNNLRGLKTKDETINNSKKKTNQSYNFIMLGPWKPFKLRLEQLSKRDATLLPKILRQWINGSSY